MHMTLKDIRCIHQTPIWNVNAAMTIKCVQETCHTVADQVRDTIQGYQMWSVVAPDQMNNGLYALAISLQEQQMTIELLTVVTAFVDSMIYGSKRRYEEFQYVWRLFIQSED
jgi:hypothetical protein